MKKYIILLFAFLILPFIAVAQEEDSEKKKVIDKPERPAFESSFLIDNPTNVLFNKGTMEVQMGHRFGLVTGTNDLVGFWGASNIRIGVAYSIFDRLAVGFGTTKDYRLQDFNLKGAILQQTRSGKIPLSITYYGNWTVDARPKENFPDLSDRWSFFHQLIFAKRINSKFSLQVAPSWSHFNTVDNVVRNDMIAIAIGGRYKITPGTSFIVDYSQPLTKFYAQNPHPGISAGFEFGTSAHTFSIFATNYNAIVPQYNYVYNDNDFFSGDILIGFNITRNYNF